MQATIFGKPNCVWCDRAKTLCDERGIDYRYVDVTADRESMDEMQVHFPGARSVPRVVLDGRPIGGYEELREATRVLNG